MSLPSTWIPALPSPTARANTPTTRSAKTISAALGVTHPAGAGIRDRDTTGCGFLALAVYSVRYSPDHLWFYVPEMRRDEAPLLKLPLSPRSREVPTVPDQPSS